MKNQHGGKRPWTNEKKLRKIYHREGSQAEVAEVMGCSKCTIENWMKRHGIMTYNGHPSRKLYNREKLAKLYEEEQSVERVLDRLPQTTSLKAVCDWLDEFDIETNPYHVTEEGLTEYTCDNCGESFKRFQSKLKNYEHKFCEKGCWKEWIPENAPNGKDSPNWEGGYSLKYSGSWRSIRRKVRKRDGECQKCGKVPRNRNLDVHHIKPVREFDNFENAHSDENLVSLCRSCHGKVEKLPEAKQREIIQ